MSIEHNHKPADDCIGFEQDKDCPLQFKTLSIRYEAKMRERKYGIVDGVLVKKSSGVPISDDEPLFILRAKDKNALPALAFYVALCEDLYHRENVMKSVLDFKDFAAEHPERMAEPNI